MTPMIPAATYPTTSPISAQVMRRSPRPQTLKMTIVRSVSAATVHSAPLTGGFSGARRTRRPAMPADQPIMKITSPEISGGKNPRRRLSIGAMMASSRPAKSVIPNTSGKPPVRAAKRDGAR